MTASKRNFAMLIKQYPAYHMNKLHWISVLLPDAPEDVVRFLVNVSFEVTKDKRKHRKA